MRILIVEDDKWFAESVREIISEIKESEIKIANDGEAAINIIDEWQPGLILLDMMLGTKNGLTLLNELQSYIDTRAIPIIIMSVDGKRMNIDNLRQFGVVDIIDKTEMTKQSLLSVVKNVKGGEENG